MNLPRTLPWATLSASALCLSGSLSPTLSWLFEYDRGRLAAGDYWRLWTCSFAHFGATHLFWNLLLVLGLGAWLEKRAPTAVRWFFASAPLAVGLTLWVGVPNLDLYRGASGIAAGLVAYAALTIIARQGQVWIGATLAALLAVKIALEIATPAPLLASLESADIVSMPAAHIAGVGCAMVVFVFQAWARRKTESNERVQSCAPTATT
jgi:rhomboid family GlyGly-CTERM serine protease